MWVNINHLHPLFATICYPLSAHVDANAVSKSHYSHLQMRTSVLGYADVVNNRIHIPFIYIILINSPNRPRFGVFGLAICYVYIVLGFFFTIYSLTWEKRQK
jgi:hypothetical protein